MNIKSITKISTIIILTLISILVLNACSKPNQKVNTTTTINNQSSFEQITQTEAKNIMDTQDDYIILDVRTIEEYNDGHIKGAILIPDYEIATKAKDELKNKNQLILVYCRSGRRSKLASQELANQGYTNIKEFGGINTWQYDIVK